MNRILVILCLLVTIPEICFAQDKIIKQSGDTILAKVTEVNISEIRYKKESNIDGPTYVIAKSSVVDIIYSNGEIEHFAAIAENKTQSTSNNVYKSPSSNNTTYNSEEIFIKGYTYYYQGRRISKRKLQSLIVNTGNPMVIEEYDRSKTLQTIAYVSGFASIPVFYAGIIVSAYSFNPTGFWVGFAAGNAMLITNHTLRKVYKNKRKHAVELYNEHIGENQHNDDYY